MKNKKILIVGLTALVLLLASTGFYLHARTKTSNATAPSVKALKGQKIDLSPATAEDKQNNDQRKQAIADSANTSAQPSSGKKTVTPIITSADKNGANAYVPTIFEEGGTCTATFTKGDDSIKATSQGFQNSNYTSCAPIMLDGPLTVKGTWQVVVSYASSTAQGNSEAMNIEVK